MTHVMKALVDGKVVQLSLSDAVMAAIREAADPRPFPNNPYRVGNRVKPIGWTDENGEPLEATVTEVTEGGVRVMFWRGGTYTPFFFCIESVEPA